MISVGEEVAMGDTWAQLIAEPDRYQMDLNMEDGTRWESKPPYPDMEVLSTSTTHVRRTVLQDVSVEVRADERQKIRRYIVRRLVAELENGEEIELQRFVIPATELPEDSIDLTICGSCGGRIPDGDAEVHEGVAYHRRCME